MSISIGTSGFTLQNFYPESVASANRLEYYQKVFPTVEINSTFYHIPQTRTLERWQQTVSKDFVFAFKVFKGITHQNQTEVQRDTIKIWFEKFLPFATPQQKHIMLFQFPATFAKNERYLEELLECLPETYLYAFEFRHQSWFIESVYQQTAQKRATIVLADAPLKANGEPIWPRVNVENVDSCYIRFHGAPQLYRSSYTSVQLQEYAAIIKEKVQRGKTVYAYFNNDASGHAAANAQLLGTLLK